MDLNLQTRLPRYGGFHALIAGVVILVGASGCVGYRYGTRSLFDPTIRSVHVPVIRSESLRPGLDVLLTEAIVKEIEARSHMKVVDAAYADSVLSGTIGPLQKIVVAENAFDEPRETSLTFMLRMSWTDRYGRQRLQAAQVPIPGVMVNITQRDNLIAEAGQSMATSQADAIARLAQQVVGQMEMGW